MKLLAHKFLLWLRWRTILILSWVLPSVKATRNIQKSWPNARVDLGQKVAVFAHRDKKGYLGESDVKYLNELHDNGYSIVFVWSSGKSGLFAIEEVRSICAAIVVRKNIGHDFGAWRDAMFGVGLPRANTAELLLVTNKFFGPFEPLKNVLDKLNYEKADVWGMTESWRGRYHLQSFFLAFGPKALQSEAFQTFWHNCKPVPFDLYVSQRYEIGLTQQFLLAGLRLSAIWTYQSLIAQLNAESWNALVETSETPAGAVDAFVERRRDQELRVRKAIANRATLIPTTDLWRQLLVAGFPFIERELLLSNPKHVADVGDWMDVVSQCYGVDSYSTLLELRSMLEGSAP